MGGADLTTLPAGERARRYRDLAQEHLHLAETTVAGEARAAHLELAALWMRLAAQAEHQVGGEERSAASAATEPRPSA